MLNNIRLQSFRSYHDASFEFDAGVNIIVGPNASGKTNLMEAILMLCQGRSYRARDVEVIFNQAPWARIDTHLPLQRTLKLIRSAPQADSVKKEFIIDDQKLVRLSLQKSLPVVLFEPDHMSLLTRGPDKRREYMDDLIQQTVPGFANLRQQYKRALAQRNRLLKLGSVRGQSQLFVWNVRLSELGAQIVKQRLDLISRLSVSISQVYSSIAVKPSQIEVDYRTACKVADYGSSMLRQLESSQDLDFERGFTALGPHRDDLSFNLNNAPMSVAASRGETRTMLLALKIMELRLIEEARGRKPILLLDDVFSELDGARRRALTDVIAGYQTFITTTDADVVIQHFMQKCNIIPLTSS